MPGHDLNLLIDAARHAGDIALKYWNNDPKVWDKAKDDPVTEADFAVDAYLRETLTGARPDHGWLSEETEDTPERLSRNRVFVVDPIDGTRAFVSGQSAWAHSIALVEDGTPIAGVVFLPAQNKLYAAERGGGATLNGAPLSTGPSADPIRLLSNKMTLDPKHWPAGPPQVDRSFRPSLAYRLSLVGEGRFDAMVTFRDSWEWDIAAGVLIAAEAGARATDRDGVPLRFNSPHPATPGVITAKPKAYDILLTHRGLA